MQPRLGYSAAIDANPCRNGPVLVPCVLRPLVQIQAELRDVQQQIEQLRRGARVTRDAQDICAWERQITELTNRLSGLLLVEARQRARD
jgi:hypothetical protein